MPNRLINEIKIREEEVEERVLVLATVDKEEKDNKIIGVNIRR